MRKEIAVRLVLISRSLHVFTLQLHCLLLCVYRGRDCISHESLFLSPACSTIPPLHLCGFRLKFKRKMTAVSSLNICSFMTPGQLESETRCCVSFSARLLSILRRHGGSRFISHGWREALSHFTHDAFLSSTGWGVGYP